MNDITHQRHEQFLTQFTVHEPAIRAYVRRLVPTRADAADVMQDIALVLWRKFEQLETLDEFRPWAFGVARYEVLAWTRDKARNRHVLAQDVLQMVADEAAQQESRLEAQRDALEKCLGQLPDEQQQLVREAYAPKAQMADLARRAGRTVNAFYQWLHRTRCRLLDCTRNTLRAEGVV